MVEIGLQEYCDEIRALIREGASREAIAHCQHILKSFPKFIEAYRLLAEASLDQGDHEGTADAFQRVLSADPEDMIAYVGLSMIYEEQGDIDSAVWNMERAFELSPEDMEIRKELQRLYSQRDGTDRSRVKLTPPALGRLYMKGALYQQAIDEFKPLFEEAPDRLDIQLSLAEALWMADQRREAAEVCQNLLDKAPNCLKANLILAEIWAQAGDEQQMQARLKTARELDPENLAAQELLKDKLPLEVQPVSLQKLAEMPAEEPEEELVDLEDISLDELETAEEPDWLTEAIGEPKAEEPAPEAVSAGGMDWLDEDKEFSLDMMGDEEIPEEMLATMPSEDASPEELMAWMQQMQGSAPAAEPEPEPAPAPEPEPEPKKEKPARQRGGPPGLDEEEEVSIAALEAEMGISDEEEVDISDEMKMQLESSMPPEDASPEEIMAWLEQSRVTPKQQVVAEEEEEIAEEEVVPAIEFAKEEEEIFPEVPVEELVWEEEEEEVEIDLEAALGEPVSEEAFIEEEEEEELFWAEEEEAPAAELVWEEEEITEEEEFVGGELIWEEEEMIAEEEPARELFWEEEEAVAEEEEPEGIAGWEEEPAEELVWKEAEEEAPMEELVWEEEVPEETPVGEISWEEEIIEEEPAEELGWEEEAEELTWEEIEEAVEEPPVEELVWEEEVFAEEEIPLAVEVEPSAAPESDYTEKLIMAQNMLEQQRISESLSQYGEIISSAPELLGTVIADLEDIYSPNISHLSLGYLLGEAYTRANRLEEALELYRDMLANL